MWRSRLGGIALCLLVGGCAANKIYHVSSDPPGAVVGSGNVVYGTTPFVTDLNAILPHRGWDGKAAASRVLTFTKDGYRPGSAVVTEYGGTREIHVVLERDESLPLSSESAEGSIESRLRKLKRLRDQELITGEEYDRRRREILREL